MRAEFMRRMARRASLWAMLAAICLALAAPLAAQTRSTVSISEIVVEGNQRIEAATIRSYMTIAAGDAFDAGNIDRSLKALFATGLFADVNIGQQGAALVVRVVENPVINRIAFEGNKRIDDETLNAEVQLRPRVVYTRSRVQSDVQRIVELYRRSGRFAATVEPKVIQLEQNRVDLVYEINEGKLTEIRKITFIGNRVFSDRQLRSTIATKESRWYRFLTSDDTYDPDRLSFDRELLRRYYLANGYADFRVVSAMAELSRDRRDFFVTFTIEEGEPYRFGKIDIESGIRQLDPDSLRHLVVSPSGESYNAEQIEETIDALTFETGRQGYAFTDIRPRPKRNREDRTIDVIYVIAEGPRVYVDRINIVGNVRTLDKVIRREFEVSEGDAFNTAKLRRSRRRIRGLGFFDKVEIGDDRGLLDSKTLGGAKGQFAEDRTVITVEVKEHSTGELSFGAGYSTTEQFIGDISIRERNLLGRGQDLRLGLNLSTRRQQVDLSFTEPHFLERNVAAGFDIFNIRRDRQRTSSFDESTSGLTLRAGYPIALNLRQSVRYSIRHDVIENLGSNASRFVLDQSGSRVSSTLGYTLTYDLRDDRLLPSEGYVVRFGQDLAGFGGNVRYLRNSLSYAYYQPLWDDWVGSLSFNEGYIMGLGQRVGISDRFFLGGNNFRGFAPSGVGPRDKVSLDSLGGKLYYVATAELTAPIELLQDYGIFGRIFTEMGSLSDADVASKENLFDVGSVRVSSGVGLSWRSPLGPIRLDFSSALRRERFDETETFRFSFGTRF